MKYVQLLATASLLALAACSQQASADNRLHPLEALCVDYEQTGSMEGTTTECHRNWGHERYTIEDLTLSMMGMTQTNNRHTIIMDDQVTSWDRETNQGTVTTNPFYDAVMNAAEGDMENFTNNMLTAMGFSETGSAKTIAGETCDVWSSPQMGQMCFTGDAIVLEQIMSMGPANITRRAVSVRRNDAGDSANYQVPGNVTITQGPDLGDIMGGFGN